MVKLAFLDRSLAYRSLIIFRVVYILFLAVCTGLIVVAVNTDIERIKLDSAADFSSRVQHLETTIDQLETLATILSQSISHKVEYHSSPNELDILSYFDLESVPYSLNFKDENYQSALFTTPPKNQAEKKRLSLLLKIGAYLPHFLKEEKIEKITIYSQSPQAKLLYPHQGNTSKENFQKEINENYWHPFWQLHQNRNIHWKLIKVNDEHKLSLTVSILDSKEGLVGLIQLLFSRDVFDQSINQANGPDSLIFLSEISPRPLLIASTEYEDNELSIGKNFDMQEGNELPSEIQHLLQSKDGWVYQSDRYFLLSVPISSVFNLVYLTNAKSFSFFSSSLLRFGGALFIFLALFVLFVERVVYRNLTKLKQQDDELAEKNQLLTITLNELEETQKELIQKEKISSLGNIVAGLAHQINTPLSIAITGASYINEYVDKFNRKFENGMKKSELKLFLINAHESSELIVSNVLKATKLVDNFKLLANDESEDELSQFHVVKYAKAVLQGLKPTLDKRRIKSEIKASEDISIVNYSMSFTQVLVQLVNNAIIHGLDHDGKITIELYKSTDSKGAFINIIDDGKGIKKEDIERIFEPFFTSKLITGQSGLGLTIAHNLISGKMSGEIKVSSDTGQGCCFSIYLPNLPFE